MAIKTEERVCESCCRDGECYRVEDDLEVSVTSKVYTGKNYCLQCIEAAAPTCSQCSTCKCIVILYKSGDVVMNKFCKKCYHLKLQRDRMVQASRSAWQDEDQYPVYALH